MSRGAGARASRLIYCNFLFFLYWTFDYFPVDFVVLAPFRRRKNLRNDTLSLLKQYLHNIKQITSGCQDVPASKRTSRRGRWPRIHQRRHRQDRWAEWGKWLLVLITFSLPIFCNRSAFAQERRANVPISTGRQTVRKMKMHSDFTQRTWSYAVKHLRRGKKCFRCTNPGVSAWWRSRGNVLCSVRQQRQRFNELFWGWRGSQHQPGMCSICHKCN